MADYYNFHVHDSVSKKQVEVYAPGLSDDRILKLPDKNGTIAVIEDIDQAATGTVTSVGLTMPAEMFEVTPIEPITSSGVHTVTLKPQEANKVFCVGGENGQPGFQPLTKDHIPQIDFAKIDGEATAGQLPPIPASKITGTIDPKQAPSGTSIKTFQFDTQNAGGRIEWNGEKFLLQTSDGADLASLVIKDLEVTGESNVTDMGESSTPDAILTINNTEDSENPPQDSLKSGIKVMRGNSTPAVLYWVESRKRFHLGLEGETHPIVKTEKITFEASDLSNNILTVTHDLEEKYPGITVIRDDGKPITVSITPVDDESFQVDFTRMQPLQGTWQLIMRA